MSYRRRVVFSLLIYSFLISVLFLIPLSLAPQFIEDSLNRHFLSSELDAFVERYRERGKATILLSSSQITSFYADTPGRPQWLAEFTQGFYETEKYQVAVRNLPDGNRVYALLDESQGFLDRNEDVINLSFVATGIAVLGLAYLFGLYLARRIAAPIETLAKDVTSSGCVLAESQVLHRSDELGQLARAFSMAMQRIQGFVERERDFTRYVSHELRTPLTVFRNNLEMMGIENLQADLRERIYGRMNLAVSTMEKQIHILLLLAREEEIEQRDEAIDFSLCLENVFADYNDLKLSLKAEEMPELYVEPLVFKGILDNLLGNVREHASENGGEKRAEIIIQLTGFSVSNNFIEKCEGGAQKRFGLEIVKKLAQAVGWSFRMESGDGIFSVSIYF